MLSLIAHAVLGVATVWFLVASNPMIFRRPATGPLFSTLECVYYAAGIASIALGWYFNIRFVTEYADGNVNPLWGDGSWAQYLELMYANPAAGSAGQDYTIGNVILLPLMTIIGGRRRGINRPWLFFVSSLFTSFAFAWAFYMAAAERQDRLTGQTPRTLANA